ncbi:MAG TPA: sulfite exporter TauE/SafE family protein [Casimicrobiaceae bacterium]|nr:sulfite exporter TauE/SafE family protein [Casimicrobiaceae bacterium]
MELAATLALVAGGAIAGFVAGLSGFAFGMVAMSVWIWALDPALVAPMVVLGSLTAQLLAFPSVSGAFSVKRVLPFIIGGLIGVPVGGMLLGIIDVTAFRTFVGVVLVAYCTAMLFLRDPKPVRVGGALADGAVGVVGGIMGGLAGLPGPAPTLWCSMRGWDKHTQRGVFQAFNLAMHVLTVSTYLVAGRLTLGIAKSYLIVVPGIVVSTWLGTRVYARVSHTAFRRVMLVLLALSGAAMLLSAAHHG